MADEFDEAKASQVPFPSHDQLLLQVQRAEQAKEHAIQHAVSLETEIHILKQEHEEENERIRQEKEEIQQAYQKEMKRLEDVHNYKMQALLYEREMSQERNKVRITEHEEDVAANFSLRHVPRHMKRRAPRIIKCTQCITHNLKCDQNSICKSCSDRKVTCKRVMCKYFKKNTSSNLQCTYAHEDDGYTTLVAYKKVHKPKHRKKPKDETPGVDPAYVDMFSRLGNGKGRDDKGGSFGIA